MNLHELFAPVATIAREAGAAILEVYHRADHGVQHKADESPLTAADLAAHELITAALQRLTPELPVLSEESALTFRGACARHGCVTGSWIRSTARRSS
jgi:3'(2'), 5'-bisphosphate nucleotidase